MNAATIGQITLNLSFMIYLVIYIPQIRHNQNPSHLTQMSMGLHGILIFSFTLDFFYSLLKPLPWQYQTVSIIAITILMVQHLQLLRLARTRKDHTKFRALLISLIPFICALILFFSFKTQITEPSFILSMGTLSRIGFLSYMLPQIFRNHQKQQADAINNTFLNLCILLSTLDLISAWCLKWGWPNQIGTPITLMLTLILKFQKNRYPTAVLSSVG